MSILIYIKKKKKVPTLEKILPAKLLFLGWWEITFDFSPKVTNSF